MSVWAVLVRSRHAAAWSVWTFPAVVVLAFVVLTVLGISGSSSGMLWQYLYGGTPDPHLLSGTPRPVRSDEWLVNTPMVLAQVTAGFPRLNGAVGTGLDMSVIHDVPYADWSLALRPQNWGFFVLPVDQAFAFKWWSLAAVLLLGTYALALQLLPGRPGVAASLAVGLLLAPFTQWWFTSTTLGSLGWAACASAAFLALLNAGSPRRSALLALALALSCSFFAVVLYPPFQIPCLLVVVALGAAAVVTRAREVGRAVWRPLAWAAAALAAAAGVALAFLLTRADVVAAVAGTDYPGGRAVPAGENSLVRLLYGVLTPQLLAEDAASATAAAELGGNQSEASAFLLPGLFLIGVACWLLLRAPQQGRRRDPVLVALLAVLALFVAHSFVPFAGGLSTVTLLSLVPADRLQIGFGLLSTVLILATAAEARRQQARVPLLLALASAGVAAVAACVAVVQARGISSAAADPLQVSVAFAFVLAVVVLGACLGRLGPAVLLLAVASALAGVGVNPLYRGVLDAGETDVGRAVREVDAAAPGAWISTAGIVANAVMVETGVRSWSSVSAYPELDRWRALDPERRYVSVYNRYGHVIFTEGLVGAPLQNPQPDVISVDFDACSPFARQEVAHVLAVTALGGPCLRLVRKVSVPGNNFFIFDVVPRETP